VGLLASWVVLVPLMWNAFSTVPSLERLAQSRMVEIPTLRTVGWLVARSAAEIGVVLGLLVPWKPRRYLARLWLATVALAAWFLATTPLGLTRMSWLHRRWLVLVGASLLVAAVWATLARLRSVSRAAPGG
jgi:hypothetical protein